MEGWNENIITFRCDMVHTKVMKEDSIEGWILSWDILVKNLVDYTLSTVRGS